MKSYLVIAALLASQSVYGASLSGSVATVAPSAGGSSFSLTTSSSAGWTTASTASWLTPSPAGGTGSAVITYTWTTNTSIAARQARIDVAGQGFYVVQPGAGGNYTWWASPGFGDIITIAGTGVAGSTGDGAAATAANVDQPSGVAVDGNGNIYIADEIGEKIRRVDAGTGVITTVAGTGIPGFSGDGTLAVNATLKSPDAVALDLAGNIYVADAGNYRIRRVDHATGIITTVGGNGTSVYSGDNGSALSAGIPFANGLASDGSGNLYVADQSSRIRRIDAISGIITTIAGNGTATYSGDGGLATSASLYSPHQVALDATGDVYIADTNNSRVRRVDAVTGLISTVAGGGSGGDGSVATSANVYFPLSIAFDLAGDLYIGQEGSTVQRVDAVTQIITTVAGERYGYGGDGGPALTAGVVQPYGLATDAGGAIYIADEGNNRIRFVDFASPQITLASSFLSLSAGAGSGSTAYTISPSSAIWSATSSAGWLTLTAGSGIGGGSIGYSYTANNSVSTRVAAITLGGQVLQVIQTGAAVALSASSAQAPAAGGTGTFGFTVSPSAPWTAVSSASWLGVGPASGSSNAAITWTAAANTGSDARSATIIAGGKTFTVLQLSGSGVYTPWAGTANGQIRTIAGGGTGGDNIAAMRSLLTNPGGIALDANSNLFIADTGANKIRRVDAVTGIITTVAGTGTAGFGGDSGAATSGLLRAPQGIAVVGQVIYIADTGNNRIRMIDTSGNITTIAGNGGPTSSGDGGPAASAGLNVPRGIAADTSGNLFFSDNGSQRIRRIDAATGTIVTVAGTGIAGYAGDSGPATAALLNNPIGLAVDKAGNLFITDSANYRIRRVDGVTGLITTVAGSGTNNCCNGIGDNGPAVSANLSSPAGVAIDPAGNLIIADTGYDRVRRVDASGTIATIAGTGGCCFGDGGSALLAGLTPSGIVADGIGNLYVIDGSKVRFIDFTTPSVTLPAPNIAASQASGTGSISMTILPSGAFWGAVSSASWLTVTTPSGAGNATIGYSFSLNNSVVPRAATITVAGRVLTVTQAGAIASLSGHSVTVDASAGSGTLSLTLTAAVPWTAASSAAWLTVTASGGTDSATLTYNWSANTGTAARMAAITVAGQSFSVLQGGVTQIFSIRNGNGRGTIQTIAGNGQYGSTGDGGPATLAEISTGKSVIDASGNVFVIDSNTGRVRRIDVVTGNIATVAGNGTNAFSGDGGLATGASLSNPRGIALDVSGNLFIADTGNYRVRRVDAVTGIITTVAGTGSNGSYTGDGGPATSAQFSSPMDVAVDGNGVLFIADNGNYRILRVDPGSGTITTAGGIGTNGSTTGDGGLATQAQLSTASISLDAAGDIFLLDSASSFPSVRKISAATGIISTVAGNVGGSTPALSTYFFQLSAVTADPTGNFYFNNGAVLYRVDAGTGSLTTIAGASTFASGFSGDGGPALLAAMSPQRLSLDGAGNLYSSEQSRLRYIDFSTPQAAVTPRTISTGSAAGSGQVTISVSPSNLSWTAVSSVSWLTLTSSAGTGTATLTYSFTANNTFAPRTGLITAFGQSLVVTQTGVSASVNPGAVTVSPAAGTGTFGLTTGSSVPWTASGSASWLAPTQLSGNGSSTIGYSFSANASQSSRTASITVTGQTFTVLQLGNTDQYSVWGSGGNGTIITVAGSGTNGFSGDGAPAVHASLATVNGVAVDAGNRIYIADSSNNRIRAVDPATGNINTVAGVGTPGFSGDGAQAMDTKLSTPGGVAVDASGNLYIADTGNNRIRRVDAVSGLVSTVAGSGTAGFSGDGGPATTANLYTPGGLALDASDNIYIADTGNNVIRRVDAATGTIITIAGTGSLGFAGDNGPALLAKLNQPYGLAVDSAGDVLIADNQNYRVRRVNAATGIITTVAGTGSSGFAGDGGAATAAGLSTVLGVALDAAGDFYVTDSGNYRVRRVDAGTGIITTIAGNGACCASGGDGGPAILASVYGPRAVAVSPSGVYIADASSRVRFVDLASPVVTVSAPVVTVGNGAGAGSVNVTVTPAGSVWGATSNASWLTLTTSGGTGNGSVAFSVTANNSISSRTGIITIYGQQITVTQPGVTVTLSPLSTVLGPAAGVFHVTMTLSTQVPWTATSSAAWLSPNFSGGTGNAIISWTYSANTSQYARIATLQIAGRLVAVTQAGTASYTPWGTFGYGIIGTVAGGGGNQVALSNPYSIAVDGNGDLFIGEFGRILRVDAVTGVTTTAVGTGNCCGAGDGGPATSASVSYPYGMALDTAGNLYFSDTYNNEVRRVDAVTGIITKVAGGSSSGPSGDGGPASAASLSSPRGIALDNKGGLYIAESNRVRVVDLTSGIISTYAGSGTSGFGGDGGPASQALLSAAGQIALDSAGNLFVLDPGNYRIREVDGITHDISTVVGTGCCGAFAGDGGPASQASISAQGALAIDTAGNLYISDYSNGRIRRVSAVSGIITTIGGTNVNAAIGDGGPAISALLSGPTSIALDISGNLYFLEGNTRVRFVDYATPLPAQTITFGPLSNVAAGTASITVSATASSGLPVGFTSGTPAVCTVSGTTVTIVTSGGCSITATQAGNAAWSAAAPVTQGFTILFGDIAPTDHYSAAINAMAQLGITAGCGSNNYCAGENVTRDQMAIFIVRAIYGNDNFTYNPTPYFTDVAPSTFAFKWIQKMKDLGITSGCTATTYCPGETVSRDQMAIFIMRARLGLALAGGQNPGFTYPATPYFTDVPGGAFGFAWIQRMREENITSGCTATTYCSSDPIIRGDMAIFLMRGAFNQFLPAGTPVVSQISPSTLGLGTTQTYTITATNTNFVQGTTILSPIPGVTMGAITVTSPTTLTVQLTAATNAVAQPYPILAITGTQEAVLPNGLHLE